MEKKQYCSSDQEIVWQKTGAGVNQKKKCLLFAFSIHYILTWLQTKIKYKIVVQTGKL